MSGRVLRKKAKPGEKKRRRKSVGARADRLPENMDTALKLLEDLHARRVDPHDISPPQRRACLILLANGSQTSAELAALFGVSPSCIRNDLKQLRDQMGREVQQWTLAEVLGQLAMTAERCQAMAMKQSDPGLAWTIVRDHMKLLKEFGLIEPTRDPSGFRLTVEAIGSGYERARTALEQALDPRLTGAVSPPDLPALPLGAVIGAEPPAEVEADLLNEEEEPSED